MATGIVGIVFKDGITDDEIKKTISGIYSKNQGEIKEMSYREFREDTTLDAVIQMIDSDNVGNVKSKKLKQQTLD